ncbi:MAG: hypothetical protein QOD33_1134 [Pyrinomonadaceae bacterium]|jgi:hypothetical protein|nr:hypothetical protein [Pyrinomonadaceae bacterium]
MRQKVVLAGLFLLLVFSSLSFKCDGNSTADSPWRPAAKAADDMAGGIKTMIRIKRELAQQGTITPAEELALTNQLLRLNTADKALVNQIKTIKSSADANAQKPNLCALFATVTSALGDLNSNGVLPIGNAGAKTQLTTLINALNASAAIIAIQCQ